MREHPWNLRRITHRHLHDHQNLLDLHFLTHAWAAQSTSHDHSRLPNPFEIETSLEDDTSPEDVLTRLEQAVLKTQIMTLSEQLKSISSLDEISWKTGHECAVKRWVRHDSSAEQLQPGPLDKRALLVALHHSPLAGRLGVEAFLVRRALVSEVSVELLNCPHRNDFGSSVPPSAVDALCRQQFHWLKGYFNHLNPAITPILSNSASGSRCTVCW